MVKGRIWSRGESKRTDFLLSYKPNIPVAIIEAKDNNHGMGDGMQQALVYAEMMDVPFVYSTNGDAFIEHDRTAKSGQLERELPLDAFPSPEELWRRYCAWKGIDETNKQIFTQDYYTDSSGKIPRYYQLVAIMRKDAGVDGDAQRISQLVWMIFLKIFEDKEKEYELLEEGYRSPIPEKLRWRNWASDPEGITGEELLDFVNNELFKGLKNLHTQSDRRGLVVREVFEDAYNYMKSGTLMRQVINRINEIDFNISEDRHLFGDIYEQILRDLQSAGNAGEYYTPRAITQFMVDMVDPKLGEKTLDPACGTGGFLTCAINNIRKNYVKSIEDEEKLQKSISGVEKKPLPHLLCVTNMLLHGIEVPSQIRHDNTLARPLRDYGSADRVDVIVTNPPFGGMEEDGIESNFPANYRTRETADLFLLLITHLLKEGGRGAIVLPDNTLFGEGVKTRIKEKLLEECNLHTIVRLPNGVFSPYTGIKTNLLFFKKGAQTKEIWFYEHPYPNGVKSYNKTKPIRIEEFEPEKAWWQKREKNERAWKVSIDEIKAGGTIWILRIPAW